VPSARGASSCSAGGRPASSRHSADLPPAAASRSNSKGKSVAPYRRIEFNRRFLSAASRGKNLYCVSQPQTWPNGGLLSDEHLEALIEAFVVPERRERYLFLARTPKRRTELTNRLAHWRDFDARFAAILPPSAQTSPAAVVRFLAARGAPQSCYVLSESPEHDGQVMPLADAAAAAVGRGMGTVLSCIPGRLAYYESEDGERYVFGVAAG